MGNYGKKKRNSNYHRDLDIKQLQSALSGTRIEADKGIPVS